MLFNCSELLICITISFPYWPSYFVFSPEPSPVHPETALTKPSTTGAKSAGPNITITSAQSR